MTEDSQQAVIGNRDKAASSLRSGQPSARLSSYLSLANKMNNKLQLLSLIFMGLMTHMFAEELRPDSIITEDQAVAVISKATAFGFGGKKGQKFRATDSAFKVLINSPDQSRVYY